MFDREYLSRLISKLMIDKPFLALILKKMWIYSTNKLNAPAATDGRYLYVNPSLFSKYSPDEQEFILLHESLHVVLDHIKRSEKLQLQLKVPPTLINIAADSIVNSLLIQENLKMPQEGVRPEDIARLLGVSVQELAKMSMEEIVLKLYKTSRLQKIQSKGFDQHLKNQNQSSSPQRQNTQGQSSQAQMAQSNQGSCQSMNTASGSSGSKNSQPTQKGQSIPRSSTVSQQTRPQKSVSSGGSRGKKKQQKNTSIGDSGFCSCEKKSSKSKSTSRSLGSGSQSNKDKQVKRKSKSQSSETQPAFDDAQLVQKGDERLKKASKEQLGKVGREILREAIVVHKMAGKSPGEALTTLEQLAKPQVNWRNILRSAIRPWFQGKVRRTWSKLNKKVPYRAPSTRFYRMPDVYLLIDTSGSIGERELRQFLSEAIGILRSTNCKVHIIPWDIRAYGIHSAKRVSEVLKIAKEGLKGGGGTDPTEAFKLVSKKIKRGELVVVLSDFIWANYKEPIKIWNSKIASKAYTVALTTASPVPSQMKTKHKLKLEIS